MREFKTGRVFVGRLPHGADLLESITACCRARGIAMARIDAIGALSEAAVAYYEQNAKIYHELRFPGHCEILSLTGTVSIRDGAPACHAHVTLADDTGRSYGGHLVAGCRIFACELVVTELQGEPLVRGFDATTGLPLWSEE
ncbi:MAG: DUF296 domain-containing protein [Spirochaetes bacterium]|nr:MAG: DUF296 domain-containing protein [Spirochaetota bacterium]